MLYFVFINYYFFYFAHEISHFSSFVNLLSGRVLNVSEFTRQCHHASINCEGNSLTSIPVLLSRTLVNRVYFEEGDVVL